MPPFVMGMQCQNVVSMLLMTLRYVVECERSLLKMPSLLCKKLLHRLKKLAKVKMNGLRLVEMHVLLTSKIEDFCESVIYIQSYIFQRKFGIQRCHKSLLFKVKNFFAK
jgi:hypothetical protein